MAGEVRAVRQKPGVVSDSLSPSNVKVTTANPAKINAIQTRVQEERLRLIVRSNSDG